MKRLMMTATALALLTTTAQAGAVIANCTMKSTSDVKSMPSAGDEHSFWQVPKDVQVVVYDQYGSQWAYIDSDEQYPAKGWVLRSSLTKCENIKPGKN